ncbi:hypothetical Protein pso3_08960 [Candidatus Phytoplasma solani]
MWPKNTTQTSANSKTNLVIAIIDSCPPHNKKTNKFLHPTTPPTY